MKEPDLKPVLEQLKALADTTRLRLVTALDGRRELCLCHLTEWLGLAPSTVCAHLRRLEAAGLIQSRRAGRWVFYRRAAGWPPALGRWLRQALGPLAAADQAALDTIRVAAPADACRPRRRPSPTSRRFPMRPDPQPHILFLCTGNSCRSQMAEGWARHLHGARLTVSSAGTAPQTLNPMAVRVMAEAGVDISGHRAKSLDDLSERPVDLVVTVCGHAHETCPRFPGRARVVHRGFDDPPHLAAGLADETARLDVYRRVRDEIRAFVETLPEMLTSSEAPQPPEKRTDA